MNVNCPHCATVFRVDPSKIPPAGVRTRCSICRGVFRVEADVPAAAGTQEAVTQVPPAAMGMPPAPQVRDEPVPVARQSEPPRPAAPIQTATAAPPPRTGGFAFGAADPAAKARRLARALVSDMVTYHPERREKALSDGTLKREFKEEIRKSWEEYVEQVGSEMALSTPHFRDALNDILARGQTIF